MNWAGRGTEVQKQEMTHRGDQGSQLSSGNARDLRNPSPEAPGAMCWDVLHLRLLERHAGMSLDTAKDASPLVVPSTVALSMARSFAIVA